MVAVTVGVACYNVEAWVEECIASLFAQTFDDFEIVAVDDGSTDRTGALLDALAVRDGRLRVAHQKNMGLGPVKNRIVRTARGRFITFVDADDWLAPQCLEEAHRRAVADDLDIVAFGWDRVEDGTGRVLDKRHDHRCLDTDDRDGMRQAAFSGTLNLASWGLLVRRQLFLDNTLSYPDCLHEDTYVTPFLYFYGRRYGYVKQSLYYWRARAGSITASFSESHIDGLADASDVWKERLSREGAYDEFRGAIITGMISRLSEVKRRIKKIEDDDAGLLQYLQNKILSIPELGDYRNHLSSEELRSNADLIAIIDHTLAILAGPYRRDEHAHIDETAVIARLFAGLPEGSIMIDVGAHHGGLCSPFVAQGWRVVAFEPNPENQEQLEKKHGSNPLVTIDRRAVSNEPTDSAAFYTSKETTGISSLLAFTSGHSQTATVSVTTLSDALEEYGLRKIDFLKIDVEGHDFMVLQGLPWDKVKPRSIVCEFEDRKTKLLGYDFHDQAKFLLDKGYTVFVSEWHPILRYGIRHDWRHLSHYPCQLENSNAWGNLIAIRDSSDLPMLRKVVIETGNIQRNNDCRVSPPSKVGNEIKAGISVEVERSKKKGKKKMKVGFGIFGFAERIVRICLHRSARSFLTRNLTSPTAATLFAGLALLGIGIFEGAWTWLAAPGLALIGLVIMKEGVLWRWRRERDLAQGNVQARRLLREALAAERTRSEAALSEAQAKSKTALAEALAAERTRSEAALSEAQAKSKTALAEALAAERTRSEAALSEAQAKSKTALAEALAAERTRSEAALATERSRRSLVDAHLADRNLPMRRVLLLFTIPRSGSTWLFDLLRTHPAVRVEPTARVWRRLGMNGWRYPGAFHHADGAPVPLEVTPGLGAAIPDFPRADSLDLDEADRWAVEKAHPEFIGFSAERLAARIRGIRERGAEVEVVYCARNPLDSMWSMAEFKARNPAWRPESPVERAPEYIARSLEALADARALIGGAVIDYEDLPDGPALSKLGQRLAPGWGETEAAAWLSHAASATERSKRRQREGAGFLGERNRNRDAAGPGGAWLACAADLDAANAAYRRLMAEESIPRYSAKRKRANARSPRA